MNNFKCHISASKVLVKINPKDISKLYANSKSFFNDMKEKIATFLIEVNQDSCIERGSISVSKDDKSIIMTINEYAYTKYKEGF